MSEQNPSSGRRGVVLVILLTGVALPQAFGTPVLAIQIVAADSGLRGETRTDDRESQAPNPHSDLIFRATGATSCRDCHRIGNSGSVTPQPIDNDLVKQLREKAKGIHGPGRFADCLRCHAGGTKGVEKYSR